MLKYLSLFSGIGSPEQALKNLGVEFELFGFSEIDKYAIKSYCAVHGVDESLNLGDITKIDIESLPLDIDLITHGSPCQDFSVAGNGKGGDLGSGTRSSLMWNTVAICEHCQPKFVIWENVKNVLSKKHRHNFDKYLEEMDRIGYNNFYQVLNAKDYGVPQNRERIFVVSIRKDIEKDFKFPKGFDNGIRLKDILEDEVDEKYYINTEKAKKLISEYKGNLAISHPIRSREFEGSGWKDNCPTLCARDYKDPKNVIIPCITPDRLEKRQNGRRFKEDGEPMFTLTTAEKDNVLIETDNKMRKRKDIKHEDRYCEYCNKKLERKRFNGRLEDFNVFLNRKYCDRECMKKDYLKIGVTEANWSNAHASARNINRLILQKDKCEICGDDKNLDIHHIDGNWRNNNLDNLQCLCRSCHMKIEKGSNYRIRKLTPLETWRLMGFKDEQFLKAEQVCSNTQLYKQAGNSIVVNVMEEIFKNLI